MMINIIATRGCAMESGKQRNSPANNIDSVEIEIIFRCLLFEESKLKEKEDIKNLFLPRRRFSQSSTSISTEKGKLKDCVTHSADSFNVLWWNWISVEMRLEINFHGVQCKRCLRYAKQLFMDENLKCMSKSEGMAGFVS